MTQIESARAGNLTPQMEEVARIEGFEPELLRENIACGKVVIPYNPNHSPKKVCGIGEGLRTKVNVNIGTSTLHADAEEEEKKLKIALKYKTDTVMDLSTGGDISEIRRIILENSPVPIGTVPIYEAGILKTREKNRSVIDMSVEDIFSSIEAQAADGVDFQTVHCGVTRETISRLKREGRKSDIVSRGGAFLIGWMLRNKKENPLFEDFDRLCDIARRYDVTLSLGDGLRPGSIADATDRSQVQELIILGELSQRAQEKGVQVMIEGPGHIPIDQVEANVQLEKSLCRKAPFYVLGPLVTDIAPGYDHITSAIGGALAAGSGADFLCYVTPSEHLGLPTLQDVKDGLIATRIAAHAGDIVKGIRGARDWDNELSRLRKERDWEGQMRLSIDPEQVKRQHLKSGDVCTMCGEYCAMKIVEEYLG